MDIGEDNSDNALLWQSHDTHFGAVLGLAVYNHFVDVLRDSMIARNAYRIAINNTNLLGRLKACATDPRSYAILFTGHKHKVLMRDKISQNLAGKRLAQEARFELPSQRDTRTTRGHSQLQVKNVDNVCTLRKGSEYHISAVSLQRSIT